jgi:hypothetical protein
MSTHTLDVTDTSRWSRISSVLLHEFREVIPPTLFFFVGFNLVLFTKRCFCNSTSSNMQAFSSRRPRADRGQGGAYRRQDALPAPLRLRALARGWRNGARRLGDEDVSVDGLLRHGGATIRG